MTKSKDYSTKVNLQSDNDRSIFLYGSIGLAIIFYMGLVGLILYLVKAKFIAWLVTYLLSIFIIAGVIILVVVLRRLQEKGEQAIVDMSGRIEEFAKLAEKVVFMDGGSARIGEVFQSGMTWVGSEEKVQIYHIWFKDRDTEKTYLCAINCENANVRTITVDPKAELIPTYLNSLAKSQRDYVTVTKKVTDEQGRETMVTESTPIIGGRSTSVDEEGL